MLNRLFKNRYFLIAIQLITLIAFILLIIGSINITTDDKDFAIILRNTNLANLIVWSYWWPIIIVTAILFGRFWCSICPMELITSFFGKIGLKKSPGKFLKSGWVITIFYASILIVGIHTLSIHRIPQYMAIYLMLLLIVAIFVGLLWEKRTFCTYVCPIGHLLGLYSMLSSKGLRVKDKLICENCNTKDCISKSNHYNFVGRSCTSELYPAKISDNRSCILCGQCHKSCTKDNIIISNRRFAKDLFSNIKLSWAEIGFFMIVSSFVIYEILSEWNVTKDILMYLPNKLNDIFNIQGNYKGTIKALILFILLPTTFYSIFAYLKNIFDKKNIKTSFNQLVIAILPITASMHLLKALLKTTSRIPYWKNILSDTKGIETAEKIMQNSNFLDKTIPNTIEPIINIFAILLPILGLLLSLFVIRKQESASKIFTIVAVFIYASLFIIAIIAWRFM